MYVRSSIAYGTCVLPLKFPSLQELFDLMITRGASTASAAVALIPGDTVTIPLSVRVQPRIKAYFEAQAEACGAASASAMVAMVLEGVMAATTGFTAEPGATEAVRLATLPADGPTGGFFDEDGPVAW